MQPGQTPGTLGIALGYGRGDGGENIGRAAFATGENGEHLLTADGKPMPIGANVFGFATVKDGVPRYDAFDVTVEATGAEYLSRHPNPQHGHGPRQRGEGDHLRQLPRRGSKAKGQASWNKNHTLTVHEDVNGDGVIDAATERRRRRLTCGRATLWKVWVTAGA